MTKSQLKKDSVEDYLPVTRELWDAESHCDRDDKDRVKHGQHNQNFPEMWAKCKFLSKKECLPESSLHIQSVIFQNENGGQVSEGAQG